MPRTTILSLDVGERRIGVAVTSLAVRLPAPLITIEAGHDAVHKIHQLVQENETAAIVVGLPRGLQGQETAQTKSAREFARRLETSLKLPVYLQDEAVTSSVAKQELQNRGKAYTKADIDSLAACYILEDWLAEHEEFGSDL